MKPRQAAIVASIGLAACLLLVNQFGALSAPEGGSPPIVPASDPNDEYSHCSFDGIEAMFQRHQFTEARDAINRMDQSDFDVIVLKIAIDSTIEANDLLLKGKVREGAYVLNRIKGAYENAKPVIELRDKINRERENQARQGVQGGAINPNGFAVCGPGHGHEDTREPAPAFAETARLAKMASDALDRAAKYCRQEQYADAAGLVDAVREEFRDARYPEAAEKARDYRRELNDFHAYASMQDFYQKGDATQALSYYDKLSPTFIEQYDLAKKAETMREVGRLATKALQDRSSALAQDVLVKEPNYRNAYHKQMAALKTELDKDKRDRAAKLYEEGEALAGEAKHEEALKKFFEARQADPSFAPPSRRHSDMGSVLMRQAHRFNCFGGPDAFADKRRTYNLIIENSFPEDSLHSQASNLLKELDG